MFPWTADPVITNPTFQFLSRPAAARLVHEFDATMFMVKLPDEKSFGTVPGAVTLPQADTRNTRGMHSRFITIVPEGANRQAQPFYRIDCLLIRIAQSRMPNPFKQGDHICALYESEHEQLSTAAAYVADGLAHAERCYYVGQSQPAL